MFPLLVAIELFPLLAAIEMSPLLVALELCCVIQAWRPDNVFDSAPPAEP
jgi:hypothetical protein